MPNLKTALQALAAQAKANSIHRMAEMQVQSSYVVKVLELLGWKDSDWKLGAAQGTNTGKFPDISLHDRNKHTVLVVECKDAKRADKLDGRYGNKTFVEQLYGYCRAEGINWGLLTNFVEWRLYNDVQGRLYENKKYAFLDLLWPGANPNSYVDILSEEGLAFLMKFQRTPLCQAKGKVDPNPLYYPIEKQIEDIKAKFFIKLKGWRDSLRRELHRSYGEKYEKADIDLYTQKILDRMIFMEVCHDKGIIGQDVHRAILNSRDEKYHELKKWFKEMDEQFNTELFAPMAIDHFDIDDKVLVPIIEELNEIDFKNVSVHIIGEVYENYLGEMLRVTKKSGLKVQEHKEQAKRKSQGIYYTPEYIVDYIVKNTVGELLNPSPSGREPALSEAKEDGKRKWAGERSTTGAGPNPKSLPREGRDLTTAEIEKIKVLDPACGSGSFLIKAFDLFLQAYRRAAAGKQTSFYSDLEIKKKILQHNLYGVDLDDRAVEITKLNLMLKALEGFNYSELKGRKLLPNLNLNIRVGNSLISGQTIEQLAEKQAQTTIPGLDDVIDIKPLLKLHNAFYKEVEDEEKARLIKEIEVEERRLNRKLGDNLKGYFSNLDEIKPLNYQVAFPEVYKQGGFDAVIGNPPYIPIETMPGEQKLYFQNRFKQLKRKYDSSVIFILSLFEIIKPSAYLGYISSITWQTGENFDLLREYIFKNGGISTLINLPFDVFQAYVDTGVYILRKEKSNSYNIFRFPKKDRPINLENLKYIKVPLKYINAPDYKVVLDPKVKAMADSFTNSVTYTTLGNITISTQGLAGNMFKRSEEESGNNSWPFLENGQVFRYSFDIDKIAFTNMEDKQSLKRFYDVGPKIFIRRVINRQDRLMATLSERKLIVKKDLNPFIVTNNNFSPYYILALLNSSLLSYLYINTSSIATKDDFRQTTLAELRNIPIRNIDFANKREKDHHDHLVKLVKEMLKLNKTPELRQRHSADIAVIDREIDELVYRLYGLNEAEKKVVEGV